MVWFVKRVLFSVVAPDWLPWCIWAGCTCEQRAEARFMLAEAKYGNGCFAMLTVSSYKCRNMLIWLAGMLLCADCGPSAEGTTARFFCCSSKRCCSLRANSLLFKDAADAELQTEVCTSESSHLLLTLYPISRCNPVSNSSQDTFSFSFQYIDQVTQFFFFEFLAHST